MSLLIALTPWWWVLGVVLIALLLLVTGRRMSNGASIADDLPPESKDTGPDVKPAQTGRQPDIGPENESQKAQPPT